MVLALLSKTEPHTNEILFYYIILLLSFIIIVEKVFKYAGYILTKYGEVHVYWLFRLQKSSEMLWDH